MFHSTTLCMSCVTSMQCWVCALRWSTHSLLKVSPPEDEDLVNIIKRIAGFIAEGGSELEKKAMEDYKDNPIFS